MGSWSLCTEEQFYIVAPLALFFFARHVRMVEKCRPWLWGMILFVPLLRAAVWIHVTGNFFQHDPRLFAPLYYSSLTHCDGLIMGLIIANLWVKRVPRVVGISNPWGLVAVAVALLIALHMLQKEIFDFTALALLFGSLVWLGIQRQIPLFNSRLFYWISRLSFGMYLNHEYMCPWIVHTILPRLPFSTYSRLVTNLIGVIIVVILSAAIALVTFCCVEYPFLQLRKRVLTHQPHLAASLDLSPIPR